MITVKPHLNRTISKKQARCLTIDVKDYYCSTSMTDYEDVNSPLLSMPQEIIDQHELLSLVVRNRVHFEVHKDVPSLKEVDVIDDKCLSNHLINHACASSRSALFLWKHKIFPIGFTLVVENFDVKFIETTFV